MWGGMSPSFLLTIVIFLLLLALGIVLICLYHDELKKKPIHYKNIFLHTWRQLVASTSLLLPVLAALLALWVAEGMFLLIRKIPYLGNVVNVALSFVPFFWILAFMLVVTAFLFFLFLLSPILALKTLSRQELVSYVKEQAKCALFTRLILFIIAVLPFFIVEKFLAGAARWAFLSYAAGMNEAGPFFQVLFILLPSACILSPTVIFFFNMAAETHIFIRKKFSK
jgi:hypothetical protein